MLIEKKADPEFALLEYTGAYDTWEQVAGYFDGDGSVYLDTSSHDVLQFCLVWVDNCREQLGQLRSFLISQGISTGEVLRRRDGVFTLQISSPRSVLVAAKFIMSRCFKKKAELSLVIEYYENRISGTDVIAGMNSAVSGGVRVGKIRNLELPKRYEEGKRDVAVRRGRRSQFLRRLG